MNLTFTPKKRYGRVDYAPVCEKANLFCDIARQDVLTQDQIRSIIALGYDITEQHESTL